MRKGVFAMWRSSTPAFTMLLFSLVTLVVLSSRGMPWRGEWQWTINWSVGTTVLTGPLLSGLSAYETGRWRSAVKQLLIPGAKHRFIALATPFFGPLCSATLVYVTGITIAVGLSAARRPTDSFSPEIVLLGLLLLALYAGVGRVVGQYFQPLAAAAIGVVVGYTLVLVSSAGSLHFLRVGGSTGPLSGLSTDWSTYLAHICWLVSAMALAAIAVTLRLASMRRLLYGSVAVAILGALLGFVLNPNAQDLYAVDARAQWRCEGEPLQTCLLLGNTSHLRDWSTAMNATSAPFRAIGFTFPARFKQPLPSATIRDENAGEIFFDPSVINVAPPTSDFIIMSLATPAACRAFSSSQAPIGALMARSWLASWMKSQIYSQPDLAADPKFESWRKSASLVSQRLWARTTFDALRACDMNKARLPIAR